MWRQIFEQIIVGLLIMQIIMAALLGIKKSFSAILVCPWWPRQSCLVLVKGGFLAGYTVNSGCLS